MYRTILQKKLARLSFFEWAYGHLAEADSDLGVVGEYLIGKALDCLPPARRVNAKYDLVLPDGRGIEVKVTSRRQTTLKRSAPQFRWDVGTQFASLDTLADFWLFLTPDFPSTAAADRRFDVFDPRYWSFRLATAAQLRSTGVTRYITEKTLGRLGIAAQPLRELKSVFHSLAVNKSPVAEL